MQTSLAEMLASCCHCAAQRQEAAVEAALSFQATPPISAKQDPCRCLWLSSRAPKGHRRESEFYATNSVSIVAMGKKGDPAAMAEERNHAFDKSRERPSLRPRPSPTTPPAGSRSRTVPAHASAKTLPGVARARLRSHPCGPAGSARCEKPLPWLSSPMYGITPYKDKCASADESQP